MEKTQHEFTQLNKSRFKNAITKYLSPTNPTPGTMDTGHGSLLPQTTFPDQLESTDYGQNHRCPLNKEYHSPTIPIQGLWTWVVDFL